MPVQLFQYVDQRLALAFIISSRFTDQRGSHDGILVSRIVTRQISVAFLITEQISKFAGGFKLIHLLADIFEAGQRVKHRSSVMAGNGGAEFTGYDRLDDRAVGR
ncbi:hypothetical protein D3C81_733900 [compost metagenome]